MNESGEETGRRLSSCCGVHTDVEVSHHVPDPTEGSGESVCRGCCLSYASVSLPYWDLDQGSKRSSVGPVGGNWEEAIHSARHFSEDESIGLRSTEEHSGG